MHYQSVAWPCHRVFASLDRECQFLRQFRFHSASPECLLVIGCALSRLHSQPLMSAAKPLTFDFWLRASFDVSRYRAHASRALAFAAAYAQFKRKVSLCLLLL